MIFLQLKVVIAGQSGDSPVKCTRGVQIKPEMSLDKAMDLAESKPWDVIILPGMLLICDVWRVV